MNVMLYDLIQSGDVIPDGGPDAVAVCDPDQNSRMTSWSFNRRRQLQEQQQQQLALANSEAAVMDAKNSGVRKTKQRGRRSRGAASSLFCCLAMQEAKRLHTING